MTKEALEKEAREYLAEHSKYSEVFGEFFVAVDTLTAMLDFAEPREKRIAELEAQVNRQIKNVLRLEAQIEKMKCCPTCDNNKEEHTPEEHYRCKTCKKFCNLELAD